ncbi:hypothetical protein [Sphingomonas sp. PAMC 26617]|uniref:hypothetical protein n=1 Tax=Sphingomonas sp. PAMC 26617 TaxID=1112216 RepID=UPI0002884257|nr:hypothetical protein [Sphingomonas sp. PAMC 26617]
MFATRDPLLINSFANDPDILPFCGFPAGTAQVDMRSKIANPAIVFVTDGDGAMICFDHTASGWEFHSMFRRSCRGRKAITAALAMFDWLVRATGARFLLGTCPIENQRVRWFCRQLGMTSLGITHSDQFGSVERFRKELVCL